MPEKTCNNCYHRRICQIRRDVVAPITVHAQSPYMDMDRGPGLWTDAAILLARYCVEYNYEV